MLMSQLRFVFTAALDENKLGDVSYFIGVVISLLKCAAHRSREIPCTIYRDTHPHCDGHGTKLDSQQGKNASHSEIERDALKFFWMQQPACDWEEACEQGSLRLIYFLSKLAPLEAAHAASEQSCNHNFHTSSLVMRSVI
jgi:hypothetical protein